MSVNLTSNFNVTLEWFISHLLYYFLDTIHPLAVKTLKETGMSHTITYNDIVYNDVGVAHPQKNDKTLFGLTKFKFRRTNEQIQIIRELLPDDRIKKIQSAIDRRSQTLELVYDNLVSQIVLEARYRQQFFPFQLEGDFLRSITRGLFKSKSQNLNICHER